MEKEKNIDLIEDIKKNGPLKGIGKPERLKYMSETCYSRRITQKHRLVYQVKNGSIIIIACQGHYCD
ncbi:MAG: Txe/YoeB family addiction module toxin [Bacilli bacterium]|nr:Txe/YoeB family addiction module toxin [Bacilli bacterium]